MWLSRFFPVILFFITLLEGAKSSPLLAERATPKCTARNIEIVRRTVNDEVYFCKWWLSDGRTRSPFLEFTPAAVTKLCNCIISDTKTVSKQKRAEATTVENLLEKRQTQASCRAEVSRQFTKPCPRTTSPFAKYSAKALIDLCKCVEGKVVTSSTKKTASSSRKTSASTKKLSSSTTKKATSSTTKPSSSIKKVSTTASRKVSSSTLKASIISTKPSSSTKKVSSTTRKASSLSEIPSSTTKKASTSTKRLSSSSKSVLPTTKKTSKKFFDREQIDITCEDISQNLDINQIIRKVFFEPVVNKVPGLF
ncbi:hypothetical protein E4T47_05008 [Aureobasidium subglaciale]|nr:hypothetical protein E4T47_05008 [Aureobasidium subglaciale]